jgi:hypothetical protein
LEASFSGIHFPGRSALQQLDDEAELILRELDNAKWPLDDEENKRLLEISAFYTYPKAHALRYVVNPLDMRMTDSNDVGLRVSTIADLHSMILASHWS